jgi:hypothetical protein
MAGTYLLAMRGPVQRRRDSNLGFCAELENLADDGKGKDASGSPARSKVPMRQIRGGLLRMSVEAGVMPVEQRGQVTRTEFGSTGNRRNSISVEDGSLLSVGGTSRISREV